MEYVLLAVLGLIAGFVLGRKSQEPLLRKDVENLEYMARELNKQEETKAKAVQAAKDWKTLAFSWKRKAEGVMETAPLSENEDEGPMLH